MKTIKWGIIGTGKIAAKFSSEFRYVPNAIVEGVASRSLTKAKEFASLNGIRSYYGSYEELLSDPEIDAIYVATPHSLHCSNTLAALRQNKAVLCEKPLAMNLTEVELMVRSATSKNLLLMEGLWTAFLPHFQHVKNEIDLGRLGKIRHLKADFGFKAFVDNESRLVNKSLGGGSLLDIGIYPVFLALSLLGLPDEIKASAEFFDTGADKECNIEFYYKSGETATLNSSLVEHTPTEAHIDFEFGSIKIKGRFHEPSSIEINDGSRTKILDFPAPGLGYSYEIAHFNSLIRSKTTESPIMSFETSKFLMTLLDRIRKEIDLSYQ